MKKMLAFSFLVMGLSINVFAQEKEPKKTIIDFGKEGRTSEVGNGGNDALRLAHRHALWFDLLSAPSGFVSIGYERALTDQISVEGSLGITFSPSFDPSYHTFIMNIFAPTFERESTQYWEEKGFSTIYGTTPLLGRSGIDRGSTTPLAGPYVSASARFFLDDEVFDGFYVSPRLQFMSFNYSHRLPETGVNTSREDIYSKTMATISKSYFDVIPSLGWHWGDDRVIWSYEIGVGARLLNVHTFDSGYKVQGGGQYIHELREINNTAVIPMLSSQFKMGITL
jgi:hypothetical protein